MFKLLVRLTENNLLFLETVKSSMQVYFGSDQKRIDHALQVAGHARELLAYIDADPVVTLSAAYLHDIGIHEAERKHGSNSGYWQEIEGPSIAENLLTQIGADPALIETVSNLVGSHHTPKGIDSPEFRILWDADALVNFDDVLRDKPGEQVLAILDRHMVTEAGYRTACRLYVDKGFRGGLHDP